jgi:hypothetical protein
MSADTYYPSTSIDASPSSTNLQIQSSDGITNDYSDDQYNYGYNALILPSFKPIYYKPNNPNFATQGAVSSSARIVRLRYNAITDTASKTKNDYGAATADAMAYGVKPGGTYTLKEKHGFRNTCSPRFFSYKDDMQVCERARFS